MALEKRGKLFVIEGGDGTGKTVQHELLVARLKAEGFKVAESDFPRYGTPDRPNPASYFVRKYLQKKEFGFKRGYGDASNVNPYGASLMYALDRFDAAFCQEWTPNLWDMIRDGYNLVSNRYSQSNIGFQAAKIADPLERVNFIKWLMHLEYKVLGIPEPDLVLLLDLDPDIAKELKAQQRKTEGQSLDAHEASSQILDKAREVYLEAAKLFPDTWTVIEVASKVNPTVDKLAALHSREVIHNKIWAKVKEVLDRG